ncbi:hypothetical protein [Akkermansia sp.]|nr:hypothetical protein [Akkermansia sp.]
MQKLKAFLEKLFPLFPRTCGALPNGGKNERTKTLWLSPSMLNSG